MIAELNRRSHAAIDHAQGQMRQVSAFKGSWKLTRVHALIRQQVPETERTLANRPLFGLHDVLSNGSGKLRWGMYPGPCARAWQSPYDLRARGFWCRVDLISVFPYESRQGIASGLLGAGVSGFVLFVCIYI